MFYKKKGTPEDGELVICKVTKILSHSVFVNLEEYEKKEAMIHISEISPGRIRNLRDFVREGKVIVCKVLRIHHERGHIDLSLRRVSIPQRKKKEEEHKQEQKAEKLIETLVKKEKTTLQKFYNTIGEKIIREFGSLTEFFNEVLSDDKAALKALKTEEKLAVKVIETIKEKIKPPELKLESTIKISTKSPDGIGVIKNTFKKTEAFAKQKRFNMRLSYVGAPKYKLQVTSKDYKTAEKILQEISDYVVNTAKYNECEAEWQKKS